MSNYILGIRKQIKEFPEFQNILNLFGSIQGMLDKPLSFWSLSALLKISEYSKAIEGEKNFYKFLNRFKTLGKITRHPLSFYLLGDSESFFFAGKEQEGKSYFRSFATKHSRREVAGLLPSDPEGEGEIELTTPYLYDINDINEGMKLIPIPAEEIIATLGKNYFLDFITKLQSLVKFFRRAEVNDSLLFKGILQKMLMKISGSTLEDVVEKLFPIPVKTQISGGVETNLVYAGDLVLNYSPDYKPIPYSELTPTKYYPPAGLKYEKQHSEKHQLELFNFRFDYKEMMVFELCRIIYDTGSAEEVESFIQNEKLSLVQNNVSLVLSNNFIVSYVDKINKITMETDLIEFYVGNPQQAAFCYNYCNYMTNINKYVSLNLQKVNLSKLKKSKEDYSNSYIELVQSVWSEVLAKISFNMFGDNLERDLFATSDLIKKTDYLQYNFYPGAKEAVNLSRYFAFPPFIELGIDTYQETANIMKEEKHTLDEKEEIINYRSISIESFKKARELTFPAQKSVIYFSLEFINTFGITRLDVNRYMTLNFLKDNKFLKRSLRNYLRHLVESGGYLNNFTGEFINKYSSYTYKKGEEGEIIGAVSIINAMLSFLILPQLYKEGKEADEFIKVIKEEITKGIQEYEKVNPSNEALLYKERYDYILCFIHRLLLSSKVIWDTLKAFKNLIYVKGNEGYETLFNYINKNSIKRWGRLKYSSIESLIQRRDELFGSEIEEFTTVTDSGMAVKNDILDNLGHLLVEIDYISLLKEIKDEEIELIIGIPGNMLDKIYDQEKIMGMSIRNIFDYIYFDFSNVSLESVSGIDMLVSFLYFKLGLIKVSILIYNDYKANKNMNFIYRIFDRLIYRRQSEIAKNIINQIGQYDNDLFNTLSNKFRRIF